MVLPVDVTSAAHKLIVLRTEESVAGTALHRTRYPRLFGPSCVRPFGNQSDADILHHRNAKKGSQGNCFGADPGSMIASASLASESANDNDCEQSGRNSSGSNSSGSNSSGCKSESRFPLIWVAVIVACAAPLTAQSTSVAQDRSPTQGVTVSVQDLDSKGSLSKEQIFADLVALANGRRESGSFKSGNQVTPIKSGATPVHWRR